MMIRSLPTIVTTLCMALASGLHAKSKLGEYYLGFSYFAGDGSNSDIDVLDIELANPVSDTYDMRVGLSWMNIDQTTLGVQSDETSWWLTADYVYHYDALIDGGGIFRPYASVGIGYANDGGKVLLQENGFNWQLAVGTEILFNSSLSGLLGVNFYGMWSDFGKTDAELEASLLYWIEETHGIGLEYRHSNDADVNYIGLRYLYSWQ